jgi:hypothetical protein
MAGRGIIDCKVGDRVRTDYSGTWTSHAIVGVRHEISETGTQFRVSPAVPKSGGQFAFLDANWFERENDERTHESI